MIKTTSKGHEVWSDDGSKKLGGPYKTKKEANERLKEVEMFKHMKGKRNSSKNK